MSCGWLPVAGELGVRRRACGFDGGDERVGEDLRDGGGGRLRFAGLVERAVSAKARKPVSARCTERRRGARAEVVE